MSSTLFLTYHGKGSGYITPPNRYGAPFVWHETERQFDTSPLTSDDEHPFLYTTRKGSGGKLEYIAPPTRYRAPFSFHDTERRFSASWRESRTKAGICSQIAGKKKEGLLLTLDKTAALQDERWKKLDGVLVTIRGICFTSFPPRKIQTMVHVVAFMGSCDVHLNCATCYFLLMAFAMCSWNDHV